jgi:hypothetical protein
VWKRGMEKYVLCVILMEDGWKTKISYIVLMFY